MARHVDDLRVALAAMSDRDANDPWWVPAPIVGPDLDRPIRVAVARGVQGADASAIDSHVADGITRAADALADAGYDVCEIEPPGLDEAAALWTTLVFTEIGVILLPKLRPLLGEDSLRFLELALELFPPVDLSAYAEALGARQGIARRWTRFQKRYPLVLAPVSTRLPFPVGQDVADAAGTRGVLESMRFVTPFNLIGLPSVAVPVGRANGLPRGVQLVGDRYREDVCLNAASAIEARCGVLTPIDPREARRDD
jgi:amidase